MEFSNSFKEEHPLPIDKDVAGRAISRGASHLSPYRFVNVYPTTPDPADSAGLSGRGQIRHTPPASCDNEPRQSRQGQVGSLI
jgi:hypothetical protein